MKVAVTYNETYSPEPYCTRMKPAETRVFDDTNTLAEIWAWAVSKSPYVQWYQLTFTPVPREDEGNG